MKSQTCRVAIHSSAGHIDLMLPRDVPVGVLLPDVCDLVGMPARWLGRPGHPPLDPEKTLSENGVDDGALLVQTVDQPPPALPPVLDCAAGLARQSDTEAGAAVDRRAAAAMIAVPLAAVGGAFAVPGAPGVPHLLLGACTGGVTATIAARRVAQGRTAFTAIAFGCALIAAVTLGVTAFGGGVALAGTLLATAAVGVVVGAGSLTLLICGISPTVSRDLSPDTSGQVSVSAFAPQCLTAVVLAGAGTATVGLLFTVSARAAAAQCAVAAVVTVALTLRARAHRPAVRRGALLLCGTLCAAMTLVTAWLAYPGAARWLGVGALAAAALAGGFDTRHQPSPAAGQLVRVAEYAGLLGVIPTACWALGLFDAVRAIGPA